MNQVTKAQLIIGVLACFSIAWGLLKQTIQQATAAPQDALLLYGVAILQLVAIFILAVILLGLLEWVKIFDIKTNALLTLITVVGLHLLIVM
ncbi:MAG: hypothetical protein JW771_01925 [Candidatus Thermoplasmatota archaeon]|nr:hypothetical protein [Candidatus Thermoplasmatota archaeon]